MPDNKPPAFMFYPGDFLSSIDVAFMDMEMRGAYITLLAYSWLEYGVPNNDDVVKKILQCEDEKDYARFKEFVINPCFKLEKGRWYNPRQERERKKATDRKESLVERGKLGAEKRWAKDKGGNSHIKKDSRAIATEIEKEFENDFWLKYPRKREKKRSKEVYKNIRKSHSRTAIMNGLKAHLRGVWSGKDVQYIPYASTWLNGLCFQDDASSETGKSASQSHQLITKICPVCGSIKTDTSLQMMDVCRKHSPSMQMYDREKAVLDDVLLIANGIREELGLDLIGEK